MDSVKNKLLEATKITSGPGGCWVWTAGKGIGGYGRMRVGLKTRYTHRLSYEIYCGPIAKGLHVLHRCDNPSCINPEHLFLGTHAQNMADRDAKGRQARQSGETNPLAKLSEADVLAIKSAKGLRQRELAEKYGVSRGHISFIRTGKKWCHLG